MICQNSRTSWIPVDVHISVSCLQFENKDALAQDFILHDALLRGKSALDQIAHGMADVGMLSLICLFPVEFESLFTFNLMRQSQPQTS